MNGIFAVRKPSGPTSQDVVGKLKKIFSRSPEFLAELKELQRSNQRPSRRHKHQFIKIGHGGTLDPLADGVLVIGVGRGTKQLQSYLGNCTKIYHATALFGASTTTFDSEGRVLEWAQDPVNEHTLTNEQLQSVLPQLRGTIKQVPPVFSALKMDGKPLYEYAREGLALPRPIEPRECTVDFLEAGTLSYGAPLPDSAASAQEREFAASITGPLKPLPADPPATGALVDLQFSVSSGTYIRTLIHDVGAALGVPAHMVKLTRVKQGDWELNKNVLPLELFDQPHDSWWPVLDTVLKEGPQRTIDEAAEASGTRAKSDENGVPTDENGFKAEDTTDTNTVSCADAKAENSSGTKAEPTAKTEDRTIKMAETATDDKAERAGDV